jgi:predicted cupin superfamily sugar epimerase
MTTADELIAALGLRPLPHEGGYYRETYRSAGVLPATTRAVSTAIYYVLTPDTFSAPHRLPTDEVFHLYLGGPVRMLQLFPDGTGRVVTVGADLAAGARPQAVVPAGAWQGSALVPGAAFALLGTTMAPGFDFADYEPGSRDVLVAQYPAFRDLIGRLTRE